MKKWIDQLFKNAEFQEINEFFKEVIHDKNLKTAFWEEQNKKAIVRIRIGHIIGTFIFIVFGLIDYFIVPNREIYLKITLIRIIIFIAVLIPFYVLALTKNAHKIIQPALFITYLIFGGYIVSLSYFLPFYESALFHNFIGIILLMVGFYVILTYKIIYTNLLNIILIIGYNIVFYIKGKIHGGLPDDLLIRQLIDQNMWFFSVAIIGYSIYRYLVRMNQLNFLSRQGLIAQRNELNKANQVKTKFFSLISHDLKNLIASHYTLSDLLLERFNAFPDEKKIEIIKLLHKSSGRTLEMFNELVLWTKAQSNQISIEPEVLTLKTVVDETFELIQAQAASKNIAMELQLSSNAVLFADKNSLKTVLRNILGNALKFSHPNNKILVTNYKSGTSQVVKIEDFGVGMDPQTQSSLFQIDQTISQPGTNNEDGTGLGLILCQELLKLNGGDIWIETELGKGTKVFFSLPENK